MGSLWSNIFDGPVEYELREFNTLKISLSNLLSQLSPEDILTLAVEDTEIYEICKENEELRQACIIAAVRRYHTEKFFFEDVYNRTADYVVMLDHFVHIQDEIEEERSKRNRLKDFRWCYPLKRNRVGVVTKKDEENEE